MGRWTYAIAGLALAAVACKGSDQQAAGSDELSKDLAMASTSDGLTLAQAKGSRSVVSTGELSPRARTRVATSDRVARSAPHRTPHRDRVPKPSTEVADASSSTPEASAATAPANQTASAGANTSPAPADAPVEAPRPHPVDVSYPSSGDGNAGRRGGGIGIGDIIGVIGGVVLRGGVAGEDHCDPRAGRRGRYPTSGGYPIPINPYTRRYTGRI